MKSEVYKLKVNMRDELVAQILNAAALIKGHKDVLRRPTQYLWKQVTKCINFNGGIFEHSLKANED